MVRQNGRHFYRDHFRQNLDHFSCRDFYHFVAKKHKMALQLPPPLFQRPLLYIDIY